MLQRRFWNLTFIFLLLSNPLTLAYGGEGPGTTGARPDPVEMIRSLAGRWEGITSRGSQFVWTIEEDGRYESAYQVFSRQVKDKGRMRVASDGSIQYRADNGQTGSFTVSRDASGTQVLRGTVSGSRVTYEAKQVEARFTQRREEEARRDPEPQPPVASTKPLHPDLSEIGSFLNGCEKISANVARFVVIPTTATGDPVQDYTVHFQGMLSESVGITQYAVLKEGIEKGALKIYRGQYTLALAHPDGKEVLAHLSSAGVNALDIQKRSFDEVLVAVWLEATMPPNIRWGRSPALTGRCNLLNLVVIPKDY